MLQKCDNKITLMQRLSIFVSVLDKKVFLLAMVFLSIGDILQSFEVLNFLSSCVTNWEINGIE